MNDCFMQITSKKFKSDIEDKADKCRASKSAGNEEAVVDYYRNGKLIGFRKRDMYFRSFCQGFL